MRARTGARLLAAAGALCVLLTGCVRGTAAEEKTEAVDQNQFTVWNGTYAVLPRGVVIRDTDARLVFLDETGGLSSQSGEFPAGPVFTDGESLYCLSTGTEEDAPQLYTVDLESGEQRAVASLTAEAETDQVSTAVQMCGRDLVYSASRAGDGGQEFSLWRLDLDEPEKREMAVGWRPDVALAKAVDGRFFYCLGLDRETGVCDYYYYDYESGASTLLLEDFDYGHTVSTYRSPSGALYWFTQGDGFYTRDGETGLVTRLREADPLTETGIAVYDDEYAYLSSANPSTDGEKLSPEDYGVRIYDHEGNLLAVAPAEDGALKLSYAFSTGERVYFYTFASPYSAVPTHYLVRDEISAGQVTLYPVGE